MSTTPAASAARRVITHYDAVVRGGLVVEVASTDVPGPRWIQCHVDGETFDPSCIDRSRLDDEQRHQLDRALHRAHGICAYP